MQSPILVYLDLEGVSILVGKLWWHYRNARESMSFEYDYNWLKNPRKFALEPALKLDLGTYHTSLEKPLFGALDDSAPDRWGRLLVSYR